jgi:hypothetical protein
MGMKLRFNYLKIIFLSLFFLAPLAHSTPQLGLGIIIGSPTGLSGNYLLSNTRSIDGALAYDLGHDSNFHMHSDYLYRYPKSIPFDGQALGWYWGIGAKFRTHHDDDHSRHDESFRFGPRGVIGMNYEFGKAPVEIFGEAALCMYLIESTDLDLDLGIGARYYF